MDSDITAVGEDRPQRVLQPALIVRALTYLDVRQGAEERSAPVGASPGVCVIEAVVAHPRQSFGQTFHQVVPYTLRLEISCLHPRNRLDVGGETLLYPMMLFSNGRKRQIDHFMGHYPVALEGLLGRELAHGDLCRGGTVTHG